MLFGTHNEGSCNLILEELVARGLATQESGNGNGNGNERALSNLKKKEMHVVKIGEEVAERVSIGQLYGSLDPNCYALLTDTNSRMFSLFSFFFLFVFSC